MIDELTICLHCGCSEDVVKNQMEALSPLAQKYKVKWNNRIDRHPDVYESYSELINHSIATCDTEWMILINDRTKPTASEAEKMIELLSSGFACVFLYNVGFMGFSKELIRKIGWWDQRFLHGGWEDRDWVVRLKLADLALYESQESTYEYNWKSPLNFPWSSQRDIKWYNKYEDRGEIFIKKLKEESYPHWDKTLGINRPDIAASWNSWDSSMLNIEYETKQGGGHSGSSMVEGKKIFERMSY
jgi:hypothetical protein